MLSLFSKKQASESSVLVPFEIPPEQDEDEKPENAASQDNIALEEIQPTEAALQQISNNDDIEPEHMPTEDERLLDNHNNNDNNNQRENIENNTAIAVEPELHRDTMIYVLLKQKDTKKHRIDLAGEIFTYYFELPNPTSDDEACKKIKELRKHNLSVNSLYNDAIGAHSELSSYKQPLDPKTETRLCKFAHIDDAIKTLNSINETEKANQLQEALDIAKVSEKKLKKYCESEKMYEHYLTDLSAKEIKPGHNADFVYNNQIKVINKTSTKHNKNKDLSKPHSNSQGFFTRKIKSDNKAKPFVFLEIHNYLLEKGKIKNNETFGYKARLINFKDLLQSLNDKTDPTTVIKHLNADTTKIFLHNSRFESDTYYELCEKLLCLNSTELHSQLDDYQEKVKHLKEGIYHKSFKRPIEPGDTRIYEAICSVLKKDNEISENRSNTHRPA